MFALLPELSPDMGNSRDCGGASAKAPGVKIEGKAPGQCFTNPRTGQAQHNPAIALVGDGSERAQRVAKAFFGGRFIRRKGQPLPRSGPDQIELRPKSRAPRRRQFKSERGTNSRGKIVLAAPANHDRGKAKAFPLLHDGAGRPRGSAGASGMNDSIRTGNRFGMLQPQSRTPPLSWKTGWTISTRTSPLRNQERFHRRSARGESTSSRA